MEGRRNTRSTVTEALFSNESNKTRRQQRLSSTGRTSTRKSPIRKSPTRRSSPITQRRKSKTRSAQNSPTEVKKIVMESTITKLTAHSGRGRQKKNQGNKDTVHELLTFQPNVRMIKLPTKTLKTKDTTSDNESASNKNNDIVEIQCEKRENSQEMFDSHIFSSDHRLTPAPSEHSRFSTTTSRSMSRSVVDEPPEEHSENSDSEVEELMKRSINRDVNDFGKKYNKYSLDNSSVLYNRTSYYAHREQPEMRPEFGGNIGAVCLLLLLSVAAYFIQFICTKQNCGCYMERIQKLQLIESYVNTESFLLFLGYSLTVFLLDPLTLGRKMQINTNRGLITYNFNGFLTASVLSFGIILAEVFNLQIIRLITKNYNRLMFLSILSGLVTALWLYPRLNYDRQQITMHNPYAKCGGFAYKYFVGREIEPYWFGVINIKLSHYRLSILTTLVFGSILFYKNVKFTPFTPDIIDANNSTIIANILQTSLHFARTTTYTNGLALLVASLVVINQIDALVFEHHLANSFELQYEGFGAFVLLRYAIYPHFNCLMAKYVLEKQIIVPQYVHWLIAGIFVAGLYLKRRSNRMKYAWVTKSRSANAFESLACKFITSWPWGKLRHPNYTGEILCYIALLLPLCWHFAWPPLVPAVYTLIHLIYRTKRVNGRCASRYHSLWTLYCNRVPYNMVPYVY